jgi:histidinol-phosphate phosphatase family protein
VSKRCVFLDRDGVINVKQPDGQYVLSWQDFEFLPGVADWIKLFNALGYLAIVVTNQRCVARGLLSQQNLDKIHQNMVNKLSQQGATIDDVFVCPHECGTCECRKPHPGLVERAVQRWDIDLASSIMIGDSASDRQLAKKCGMGFVEARHGRIVSVARGPVPSPRVNCT